jgi:hypothetical protein
VGAVTVIVPLVTEQVGCVSVTVGASGAVGTALIVALSEATEVQPPELVTVNVREPVEIPLKTASVPLPVIVPPVEIVTVQLPTAGKPLRATLPVEVEQVGWVISPIIGAPGAEGSLNVALTPPAEVHPLAEICKSLYVPARADMVAAKPDTLTFVKLPEV